MFRSSLTLMKPSHFSSLPVLTSRPSGKKVYDLKKSLAFLLSLKPDKTSTHLGIASKTLESFEDSGFSEFQVSLDKLTGFSSNGDSFSKKVNPVLTQSLINALK
jgi:hypothetical protein